MTLTNCVQTSHTLAVITRIFLASQLCSFAFPARWHCSSKPLTSDWWIPWRAHCTYPLAIKNRHGKSARDGLISGNILYEWGFFHGPLLCLISAGYFSRLESSWPWDLWEWDTNGRQWNQIHVQAEKLHTWVWMVLSLLATKFLLQNVGGVMGLCTLCLYFMQPLCILQHGACTPPASAKCVWDREHSFHSCSSGNQVLITKGHKRV